MTKWMQKLDLTEDWQAAKDGSIDHSDLDNRIAAKIEALKPYRDYIIDEDRLDLASDFRVDGYSDGLMARLYDWADTTLEPMSYDTVKACWIETII